MSIHADRWALSASLSCYWFDSYCAYTDTRYALTMSMGSLLLSSSTAERGWTGKITHLPSYGKTQRSLICVITMFRWVNERWLSDFYFFLNFHTSHDARKKKLIMNTLSLMRIISWSKAAAVRYSASCLRFCFLLRRKFRFRHERIHIHRQRIQHFWDLSWATTEQHKKLSYLFLFLIIFCSYY